MLFKVLAAFFVLYLAIGKLITNKTLIRPAYTRYLPVVTLRGWSHSVALVTNER